MTDIEKKKFVKQKTAIEIIIIPIPMLIATMLTSIPMIKEINISAIISNYDALYDPIIISAQIILGLIGAISLFYLGKIHDYRIHYLDYELKLISAMKKLKRDLQIADEKTKKIQIILNEGDFSFIRKFLKLIPKIIIGFLIIISALMLVVLFGLNMEKTDQGHQSASFIPLIIMLIGGIIQFFVCWYVFEDMVIATEDMIFAIGKLTIDLEYG